MSVKVHMDFKRFLREETLEPSLDSLSEWITRMYDKLLEVKDEKQRVETSKRGSKKDTPFVGKFTPEDSDDSLASGEFHSENEDPSDLEDGYLVARAEFKRKWSKSKSTPRKEYGCSDCINSKHSLTKCDTFRKADVTERNRLVRKLGICFHCLDAKHMVKECTTNKDKVCGVGKCVRYHHKLLHRDTSVPNVRKAVFTDEELSDE